MSEEESPHRAEAVIKKRVFNPRIPIRIPNFVSGIASRAVNLRSHPVPEYLIDPNKPAYSEFDELMGAGIQVMEDGIGAKNQDILLKRIENSDEAFSAGIADGRLEDMALGTLDLLYDESQNRKNRIQEAGPVVVRISAKHLPEIETAIKDHSNPRKMRLAMNLVSAVAQNGDGSQQQAALAILSNNLESVFAARVQNYEPFLNAIFTKGNAEQIVSTESLINSLLENPDHRKLASPYKLLD